MIQDINIIDTENIEEKKLNKEIVVLPKYISIKRHEQYTNKYYLIYDKKKTNNRETYKILCDEKNKIHQNINILIEKVKEKYEFKNTTLVL